LELNINSYLEYSGKFGILDLWIICGSQAGQVYIGARTRLSQFSSWIITLAIFQYHAINAIIKIT